jgi:DNA-binding PadR family transcriptional regulator
MRRNRPPSAQTLALLRVLAVDPSRWRYGYDLCVDLGMKSGSVYPILIRLADRGFLQSAWEQPADPGKPPRHLYRLTSAGMAEAAAARAEASPAALRRAELGPA